MKLVPFRGDKQPVMAKLTFESDGSVEVCVRHEGQSLNSQTRYEGKTAAFQQLKAHFKASSRPELLQYLP